MFPNDHNDKPLRVDGWEGEVMKYMATSWKSDASPEFLVSLLLLANAVEL